VTLSFRSRLTVWYVAVLAAIVGGLAVFVGGRLKTDLVGKVDRSLDAGARQLASAYRTEGRAEFVDQSSTVLGSLSQRPAGAQLLDRRGRVVAASGDRVSRRPMLPASELQRTRIRMTRRLPPGDQRFRVVGRRVARADGTRVLVVAESLRGVEDSVGRVRELLLIGGLAALVAAAAGGWWLARQALHPVARITEDADRIGIDHIHERVAQPASRDELGRLAATLNRMLERIEAGVAEKHRLVADASHELRSPLAVMRSELDVALLEGGGLDGQARAVLESTRDEVDRMTRIVENLLTLARVDEGRLELVRRSLDLRPLLATALAPLQPIAEVKQIELALREGDGATDGDPDRLSQVVTNLADNAIKYTPRGGHVVIGAWSQNGEVGVTVEDSGPGIPADAQAQIFDRFFRLDAARARESGGSGLGLAICKEIVLAHGGRIWVKSEHGRGSAFSFALPGAG
jgi:heavy metal sensor kinase